MKKIFTFATVILAASAMMAQTYVSTESANKNVILEEYTGINCGFCPDGHRIANEICAANPGRAFAINIHTGSYAAQYSTQWGSALANQTGLTGYPSGTVNRHVFSGSSTALSRGSWTQATNTILSQSSPVNVASRTTIDYNTRQMTVDVEVYYTGTSDVNTNRLNVAVLQNNVLGQQGGSSYNPSQVEGSQYRHMHMLRHLITGQWGEQIDTTVAGTFVHRTYTWEVPASIANYESNTSYSHPVVLEDLEVIVFVAEGHQEILSGCKSELSLLNAQPKISAISATPANNCDVEFEATATIRNLSEDTMTSAELTYTLDGQTDTISWTGTLAPMAETTIDLPTLTGNLTSGTDYTLSVALSAINGEAFSGTATTTTLSKTVYEGAGPFTFVIGTDKYASETSFTIKDMSGSTIVSGGPWTNYPNVKPRTYTFDPAAGCYIIEVLDSYGDGINNGYGAGYIRLSGADGNYIIDHDGTFSDKVTFFLTCTTDGDGSVDIMNSSDVTLSVFPNPTTSVLNVECSEEIVSVMVYDMSGRMVMSQDGNASQLNTSKLANGVYTLSVKTANGVSVQKFVKE